MTERLAFLEAENFNLKFPVGSKVRVWPGVKEGPGELGVTESPAKPVYSGRSSYAVVFIRREGRACCSFSLTHVEAL